MVSSFISHASIVNTCKTRNAYGKTIWDLSKPRERSRNAAKGSENIHIAPDIGLVVRQPEKHRCLKEYRNRSLSSIF